MVQFQNTIEGYNWHDCPLYSIRFEDDLELELDYILEWRRSGDTSYEFLIAPAKLVFFKVENFEINVKTDFLNGFEIKEILHFDNDWTIQLQEGQIKFQSAGFSQSILKQPIWTKNQFLSKEEGQLK